MPTINFPKESLRQYLQGSPSDDELREAITMLGTDIERFEDEVSVEIFPNRPDLLSVAGLARALNSFLAYTDPTEYTATHGKGVVVVEDAVKQVRPHTRCAIVRGLSLDDERIKEIIAIQEKLHITFGRRRKKVAIGIYTLERIELPITYTAKKPSEIMFRPLEWPEAIDAKTLLEEHPTGKEYAHLLEDAKVFPVFLDAAGKVLSVPPVINSHDVGKVDEGTSDVFIECSGHEPLPLEQALRMIVCALADMGGSIESMTLRDGAWEETTPDLTPQRMDVDLGYVAERSGVPEDAIGKSLQRMGLSLEGGSVIIPPYRTDFLHAADVVEDVAIGYGYDKLTPTIPQAYTVGSLTARTHLTTLLREALIGQGLQEVMNFYITADGVPLANPQTQEYAALRRELVTGMLDALRRNINNSYPQRLFEIGPVFAEDASAETRVAEPWHVASLLCEKDADFTSARQSVEALCRIMDWEVSFSEHDDPRFIPGRCARISGDVEGVVGEIHPRLLAERQVQMPACGWELTNVN